MQQAFRIMMAAAIAAAAFMASAGRSPAGQGPNDSLRIGYSACNFDDFFQYRLLEVISQTTWNRGIDLVMLDAHEDILQQIDHISLMIDKGVDALLVVPVNPNTVTPIIVKAARAGIPLVFVNRNPFRDSRPPPNVYYIGADSFVEGETQMLYAGKILGGVGAIAILNGILSNEATQNRTNGVRSVIRTVYPDIVILTEEAANWRRDRAAAITETWLMTFGDKLDAIIANNDEMALGALDVLGRARMTDSVVVVGIDAGPAALDAISEGRLNASVMQDPEAQGTGAIDLAVSALNGETPRQITLFPSRLVTIDNLGEFTK